MKKLYVMDEKGEKEIAYVSLSTEEIEKRLSQYTVAHGPISKFLEQYDCDVNGPDDYFILLDWQNLLEEKERRETSKADLKVCTTPD